MGKFGQLIKYNMRNIFLQNHAENDEERLDLDLFLFLKKALKASGQHVSLIYFVHNFSRKIFIMLYSINSPNFIVWLSLLIEILLNKCIIQSVES